MLPSGLSTRWLVASNARAASKTRPQRGSVRSSLHAKGEWERSTNKLRRPAKIPRPLLAHLRRWKAQGCVWAVEYQGARVGDIKRAFAKATTDAKVQPCTPHTLKHTAITWALQNGATIWDAAGYFSTSPETIAKVYGHHSPDFQESALKAVERR
ncbi:hypothetical protein [Falsiruegeria mediterranea]|uniref:Tyr recombinase domain-containing protein n=1 Tax=Falsiruegeria mediterranea M17 TaxID=1200281 RepID=A0A2R8C935_9RHOB|nr:hypothetical protein [Falsiruegeria mediterranea]SPJ28939.1 hypothetical protein TRM7615_02448 [Falsiruegeria mediterranea M17]